MAPTNAKQEAIRLEQAKMAIKKMKQKRKEDKRPRRQTAGPTVEARVPALNGTDFTRESLGSTSVHPKSITGLGDLRPAKKKRSNKSRELSITRESPRLQNGEHNGCDSKERRPVNNLAEKSTHGFVCTRTSLPDEPSRAQPSNLFGQEESYKSSTPLLKLNQENHVRSGKLSDVQLMYDSPYVRPAAFGKVYVNRKKLGSISNASELENPVIGLLEPERPTGCNESNVEVEEVELPDSRLLKIRKKLLSSKRLKKVAKIKKLHAPMSIKKISANVKQPVFSVSLDDTYTSNESKSKGTCPPLSKNSCSGFNSTSAFSITTVSDINLPTCDTGSEEEGEEKQEECDSEIEHEAEQLSVFEDEEAQMDEELSQYESADEYKDIEDEPISPKKPANDLSRIKFHFIDGEVILQLKHPATFTFYGQVEVKVLKGALEILGYLVAAPSCFHTVFSPRGSSLLTLQTVSPDGYVSADFDSSTVTALVEGNEDDVFLLMKKAENTLSLYLEKHVDINLFPHIADSDSEDPFSKASRRLQCWCSPNRGTVIQKGESWDQISQYIIEKPGCSVLCGGKGVGKSTLLRFLVNRLLSNGNQGVVLIDFDPGQAELTIPGCVSLSVVENPLLGPNFTHLQTPLKCIYIGDVNVSNCISRYMDACSTIVNHWQSNEQLRDMPCLVNTMGFNKGIGGTIMVQLLSILQPTHVVQILSKSKARNYPEHLSIEYVKTSCANSPFNVNLRGSNLLCWSNLNYVLHVIDTEADMGRDVHSAMGIDPRLSREIALLSYLSKIVSPPNYSILDVVPYCCPLDAFYLNICHESVPPAVTLSAFNANLVALCSASPEEKDVVRMSGSGYPSVITKHVTTDCLGFGIVRGIDMETQQIYLLTPVPPNILISVNCLVLGAVSLPQSIYFAPPSEPGVVPYVIQSNSQHSNQQSRRNFQFTYFNKFNKTKV